MKTKLTFLLLLLPVMAWAQSVSMDGPHAGNRSLSTVPSIKTSNNDATSTAATGTNWTALASHAAKNVTIINTTGTTISVRYGSGTAIGLPDGSGFTFEGLTNSSGMSIKRADDSNTQVSVAFNYQNW